MTSLHAERLSLLTAGRIRRVHVCRFWLRVQLGGRLVSQFLDHEVLGQLQVGFHCVPRTCHLGPRFSNATSGVT
jgi:hypothetical protein